ncbi:MAG: rhomboid family intramembrane serine protease [Anaerolineales bacterium]|nr:rhomboid family intramembrane serine protease [Anaerolineales bacterium]MCB9126303.1 rhomboid family intramembrane serine protease [Ardenticatenales bacterium]MCB9171312.1 rhomboid family intramembrane serine protease [Ardenticatenales bacterium]
MIDARANRPPGTVRARLPLYAVRWTPLLIGINLLMFVVLAGANVMQTGQNILTSLLVGASGSTLLRLGAKVNFLIVEGELWRLFTAMFLHIGLMHIIFNMLALKIFGEQVERLMGSSRFLLIYLLSGLFGSVASFAFSPNISAGASGAIFGIIGAFTAFFLRNRETFGEMASQQLRSMGGLILVNLLLGISVPGIDNYAHLGGLISGLLLGLLLAPTYELARRSGTGEAQAQERGLRIPIAVVALGGIALLVAAFVVARAITPLYPTS